MNKSASSQTHAYTNKDIVTIAVCQLGGALRHIHLEDVAMKASELSPRRFCWKKYPDQINLELVRLTLKNELGSPNSRVLGGIRDGWMLTPPGLSWCLCAASRSDNHALVDELQREVDRAKKTTAFGKTLRGQGVVVSSIEVEALLRVNNYFTARDRRERTAALANAAVLDSELRSVLISLKEQGFDELKVRNA